MHWTNPAVLINNIDQRRLLIPLMTGLLETIKSFMEAPVFGGKYCCGVLGRREIWAHSILVYLSILLVHVVSTCTYTVHRSNLVPE